MQPVGQNLASIGRPRASSQLNSPIHGLAPGSGSLLAEDPKFSDDGSYSRSVSPRRDQSDFENFSDEDVRDDEETGLTTKEKTKRQKKRRRNTLLDQRIAREKNLCADQKRDVDKSIVRRIAINIGLVLLWYLFSLCISLYNKWMFDKDRLNFAFPLFTTSAHMVVQFALAGLVLFFVPSLRPQSAHNSNSGGSRHDAEPTNKPIMDKLFYLTRVGPCGAATGLDIGLGNTSLKFISLTFYTMCKSSSLAFVLLFAFIFRLETPTWRLVSIIGIMTIGVILMVSGEVEFKLGGFVLVISAAFFSGLRWGLTQILLLRHPATSNPFSSIFFLTPVMFLVLFGLAIPVEGFGPLAEGFGELSKEFGVILAPLFLLMPGCIAFLMTAAEFALLQRTSVVTLSIAGIFKEVLTISVASVIFHDQLTVVNLIGLIITLIAIAAYNFVKITKMRKEAQDGANGGYENPGSSSPSSGNGNDDHNDDNRREETAGLLSTQHDYDDAPLVTSDGDIQSGLLPESSRKEEDKEASLIKDS